MAFVTFQAACHSLILTPAPNSPPPSSYSLNSPLLMLPVLILSLQLEKTTEMQAKIHEEVKIATNTSTAASTSSGNAVFKRSEGSRG
ncbi:hypothetical protein ALC57_11141 [Trachymyrmex cornetzi]|uniref:Uncharacterized protein n=1 Tax=Trachymyrmex cornetzi TaxID=471704 RepID=A0A195DV65_9HYME|nr:hypothetical protein ALC57_11141 [Trachymyrmex cornetzi]